jgi:hypothetical protein
MANFSLWSPRKNQDYQFLDNMIKEMFSVGATSVFIHKYLGIGTDGTDPTAIQDAVFQENRDRHYDPDVYELLGTYNVQDLEYEMTQFGQIIQSDVFFMEFHLNDSIRRLGRKLLAGDVVELPHLRDDALLDENTPAVNKYYIVDEVTRSANGYSPTWYPHLIRAKLRVITNSQELGDIINQPVLDANGDPIDSTDQYGNILDLGDIISDFNTKTDLNNKIVVEAETNVDRRNFETQQFYIVPGAELAGQYPWVFSSDAIPPNGAIPVGSGSSFPTNAVDKDYFIRTDMDPKVLFRKDGTKWRRQEYDNRPKWEAAHRLLRGFINNDKVTTIDGDSFNEKVAISKAISVKADF